MRCTVWESESQKRVGYLAEASEVCSLSPATLYLIRRRRSLSAPSCSVTPLQHLKQICCQKVHKSKVTNTLQFAMAAIKASLCFANWMILIRCSTSRKYWACISRNSTNFAHKSVFTGLGECYSICEKVA